METQQPGALTDGNPAVHHAGPGKTGRDDRRQTGTSTMRRRGRNRSTSTMVPAAFVLTTALATAGTAIAAENARAAGTADPACSSYLTAQREHDAAVSAAETRRSDTLAPHRALHTQVIMDADAARDAALATAEAAYGRVMTELEDDYIRTIDAARQREHETADTAEARYAAATEEEDRRYRRAVDAADETLQQAAAEALAAYEGRQTAVYALHDRVAGVLKQWDTQAQYRDMAHAFVPDARAVLAQALEADHRVPNGEHLLAAFDAAIAAHYDADADSREIPHERHAVATVWQAMAHLRRTGIETARQQYDDTMDQVEAHYDDAVGAAEAHRKAAAAAAYSRLRDTRNRTASDTFELEEQASETFGHRSQPAFDRLSAAQAAANEAHARAVAAANDAYEAILPTAQQTYRDTLAAAADRLRDRLLEIVLTEEPHTAGFNEEYLREYAADRHRQCHE